MTARAVRPVRASHGLFRSASAWPGQISGGHGAHTHLYLEKARGNFRQPVSPARQDFPGLGHEALLEHGPPVGVALQQRHSASLACSRWRAGGMGGMLGSVRKSSIDGPAGRERLIPRRADLLRLVDGDAEQAQAAGQNAA